MNIANLKNKRIALLLPCLNEELTLSKVIRDFREQIPSLEVYVFDNGSEDRSAQIAKEEGARVISVPKRGKGNVVRKMFELVDADYAILVDSDDTYDAKGIFKLFLPILKDEADMVVASRLSEHSPSAFRKFHRFGNKLIMSLINFIFGSNLKDICSGYRVMTKNFISNIPLLRDGFEIETELSVHALIYDFRIKEIALPYRHRPPNSHSKLRTFSDGYKVLLTIVGLARDLRPLLFFSVLSLCLFVFGVFPALFIFPKLLLVHLFLSCFSIGFFMTGLILNTINVRFSEFQTLFRKNHILRTNEFFHRPTSLKVLNHDI